MTAHIDPDKAVLAAFIAAAFKHADPDTYAILKGFDADDRNVFPANGVKVSHPRLVEFAFNRARQVATCGRTAVFCPPVCTFRDSFSVNGRWSAKAEDLANGLTLSVDADKTPVSARETLTGHLGPPTITVASGGLWANPDLDELEDKLHLHWRLSTPTRTEAEHLALHEARWLACMIAGGDTSLAPIVHPLRWPGSVHTKEEPRLSRIVDMTDAEIDLGDALVILRAAWTGPAFNASSIEPRRASIRTADHDDVASACNVIPNNDLDWDAWKETGMAIWAATNGQGFDVFDEWSKGSAKYDPITTVREWRKINRSPPTSIGAGTLFFRANEADPFWVRPSTRVDDAEFAELANGTRFDAETGEVFAEIEAGITVSASAPPDLTHVPGLLGEVIDWIVETDRRPNRMLALGAALTTLGTLMGRRVAGPTLSGTHLYAIALAPSGAGKDHALNQVTRLVKAANAEQLIGPSGFMSYSAVVRYIHRQPLSVCVMDELGAFLKKLSHKKAGVHEQGITAILRSAWGSSFQAMRTPEWSGTPSEEIQSPALSIYGVSVPEEFFAAMQGSDVTNGFLNRFLMIEGDRAPCRDDDPLDPFVVPERLRHALLKFYMDANRNGPNATENPFDDRPKVMPWLDDAAGVYASLSDELEAKRDDPTTGAFYARTAEMAVRLATIRAAGNGFGGIMPEDMAWGRNLALWSAERMIVAAAEHMAGNEFAAYQNRIAGFMKRKGVPVTRRDMQMAIKSELTTRQLGDCIDTMVQAGRIVPMGVKREPGSKGRPPPTHYRLA